MSGCIEKQAVLSAPVSRVWRAITDHREFGEWFGVRLDAPFTQGEISTGNITYPGYEYLKWEAEVQALEPERLFSFAWAHPRSLDREQYTGDYSKDPKTKVEFRLEPANEGTLLRITESGFEMIPADYREEAYRRNEAGWSEQIKNIEAYLGRR
ncbi:MAG TPA: SRPBCC family protein [Terriglobales bacterium]|nr:SRPBCC family protein [Terriglobales bacterium]